MLHGFSALMFYLQTPAVLETLYSVYIYIVKATTLPAANPLFTDVCKKVAMHLSSRLIFLIVIFLSLRFHLKR